MNNIPKDLDRLNIFLNNIVYINVDINYIKQFIVEKKLDNHYEYCGIFFDNEIACIVPKIYSMQDELVYVHEITHLVNYLVLKKELPLLKEIVPYFNELEYIKQYDKKLVQEFLSYKKEKSINSDESHLYAYLFLEQKQNEYDIYLLNKINTSNIDQEQELIKNGFDIKKLKLHKL